MEQREDHSGGWASWDRLPDKNKMEVCFAEKQAISKHFAAFARLSWGDHEAHLARKSQFISMVQLNLQVYLWKFLKVN